MKTFLERLFSRLKRDLASQTLGLSLKGMKQKGLVSLFKRKHHLLRTDFNFYVV